MAKRIELKPILSINKQPIKVAELDSEGNSLMTDDKRVKTKDATMVDILNLLIVTFPRDRMTMENITHGTRLKGQLLEATNGCLVLEEAEHDWVKKMLNDEAVGCKLFGFELLNILQALDDFERPSNKEE